MDIGLFAINYNTCGDPEIAIHVARAAEAAGFESVWTGEHLVLPDPQSERSPLPPETPFLDTVVSATLIAANTDTIRIGTGIILLPLRNPVVLAKELASVDVVSRGRLIAGFGVGYLEAEFDAVGVPMSERGSRMTEYLGALQALWTMDEPAFDGHHVSFEGIDAQPRPVQRPMPHVVLGGGKEASVRRAWRMANGFYAFGVSRPWVAEYLEFVATLDPAERPNHLGRLQLTVTPVDGHTPDDLRRYEEIGVDRVVMMPGEVDPSFRHRPVPLPEILATIETTADGFLA